MSLSHIGLIGLGVMGQNLALNIAEKGFPISVWNRSYQKAKETEVRAVKELGSKQGAAPLRGFEHLADFVKSIRQPRAVIVLVQAGKPVDDVIAALTPLFAPGDLIIDGGNEWYKNTQRRISAAAEKNLLYLGMGVSGGEEGARHGPSLMPGGSRQAYEIVAPILNKIAAQVDGGACVTYIGDGGAGNYVKMIHNGIEYGDMQLIAEAYDLLKNVGHFTNDELANIFKQYNQTELDSFLIEITSKILTVKDPAESKSGGPTHVVDFILDKTGNKGTGKWTVQEAAEQSVPAPTMASALDARFMSALKDERVRASTILTGPTPPPALTGMSRDDLVRGVRHALYASKICSYTQGMNLIREAGKNYGWSLNLGEIARIWKGGCIIRAKFLDRIKSAYDRDSGLVSLLVDPEFAREMNERQSSLRQMVCFALTTGIAVPAFSASLAYFDSYRRARLPANLTQAQRDFFGAHTYERIDRPGWEHTEWIQQ